MKTINRIIALLCCVSLLGCNNDNIPNNENTGGFWIKVGTVVVPNSKIDYYDFSTHTVYFKEKQSFFKNSDQGSFSVYVDNTEIYKGTIHPMYLNSLPTGPYIYPSYIETEQYTLTIGLIKIEGQKIEDPRCDSRIADALKSQGKYHAGLQMEIQSIRFLSDSKVTFDFQLSNQDTFDYLYLDPDKMGMGLFHYFTNGLTLLSDKAIYYPQISVVKPEPWNLWKKEWMSVIRSGESKQFTITYDSFDSLPSGNYRAFFSFPGLQPNQIEKKDLNQPEGRIWLGEIVTTLNCTK